MTDIPDNFADHPLSIAEIRADKSQNATDWTPRDVLIELLRDIDSGAIAPDALIVAMSIPDETFPDGYATMKFRQASPSIYHSLGLAQRFITRIQEPD